MRKFLLKMLGVKEEPKTEVMPYIANGNRIIGIHCEDKECKKICFLKLRGTLTR